MDGAMSRAAAQGTTLSRASALAIWLLGLITLPLLYAARTGSTSLTEDGARFELAGMATFRWMSALKVYDATLHVGAEETPARALSDVPLRLRFVYHRGFTAEEIAKGGDKLLSRNVDAATLAALRERLDLINRSYRDVKPGDSYTLTYVPGKGTTLRLNDAVLVTIPGQDFYAAYFRIWLGDNPISKPMRDALLGR